MKDQHEGMASFIGRRQVAGAHRLEHAHQQPAHHRAEAVAEPAEHRRDEALQAEHDPTS